MCISGGVIVWLCVCVCRFVYFCMFDSGNTWVYVVCFLVCFCVVVCVMDLCLRVYFCTGICSSICLGVKASFFVCGRLCLCVFGLGRCVTFV